MISKILIFIMGGLRPFFGPASCYFEEGCTAFSIRQVKEKNIFKAFYAIFLRLLSCNPINARIKAKNLLIFTILLSQPLFLNTAAIEPGIKIKKTFHNTLVRLENCNGEFLRNATIIKSFLQKLTVSLKIVPQDDIIIRHGDNGYTAIQILSDGSVITVAAINSNNLLCVNLLLTKKLPAKKIGLLAHKYFKN